MLTIIFDPNTAYITERQVGGDGEDESGSGRARVTKVKRPFFAFKSLKLYVDTPEEIGDVWFDGVRYKRAFFEI